VRQVRRRLLIGGSILAACAIGGGAYAAVSSNTSPRDAFLNDVANRLHVSPQQLRAAFQGAALDQLKAAVKAGRLTQAQANAIGKRLREGGPAPLPFFHRGLMPDRGLVPGRPFFTLGPLGAATEYIGVTPGELFNQLSSGKSLAQIARAHGKSGSGLESAMATAERARLDRARRAGLLTSSQEQRLLSRVQARISALVNRMGFAPRFRPLAGPKPFFGPHMVPRASVPPGYALPGGPPLH
jgi:AraC-like DNA-binding protein